MIDGGPAFPTHENNMYAAGIGMSLCDYFAAHALTGFIQGGALGHLTEDLNQTNEAAELWVAMASYRLANAMLAARPKGA